MKRISTDELKANLEEYLRAVQAGERVVVCEHQRAVAQLVRTEGLELEDDDQALTLRGGQNPADLRRLKDLPPLGIDVDVVAILRESRDQR